MKTSPMTLSAYLAGLAATTTADELEAAIQAPFRHSYRGRTWSRICRVRDDAGRRIVAAHPLGRYIPQLTDGRMLVVCGQSRKIGRGQNSTGVRYVWTAAGDWAQSVLRAEGLSGRAAHRIWSHCWEYSHRGIAVVEAALAGQIPDPELGVLIRHASGPHGRPIQYSIAQNEADEIDPRATRACPCGGTLFDWGAGDSEGFPYISWHCNQCPDTFTEYMTSAQLYTLRQSTRRMPNALRDSAVDNAQRTEGFQA